ncbi:3-ketoacyl-CoA thiolase Acetyl-CoA acetyltransferase [Nitrincola lacisaponensis]|uniref:acetyl-CoA C-acyltransferase n=1 Tax=Nitrincola lacisaponensis TaxID=267850 RepID=A0A063XXX3_9GAMM|nr:acetyl-CoA C-acyltransferase [Nitrincola lacisaponensis]KDE38973.1 3-ketoacyl-CoA thiolase Acetyl-CoA acetyltransferase [Nitrincola lacisaponensis]
MKPVYLSHYRRTAFSRANPKKPHLDAFADLSGPELLNALLENLFAETQVAPDQPDELTLGCALGVKEQWSFGGRYPLLQTALGDQCATRMLDQQCGSGLAAIRLASFGIASGQVNIALAGGYEHMTRVPMGPGLFQEGVLTQPRFQSGYEAPRLMNMGLTAESLAQAGQISREAMDRFACRSHRLAAEARESEFTAGEILPIDTPDQPAYHLDACIREATTFDALTALNPVFEEQGSITAGNSSPLTSGAGLLMLMSEDAQQTLGQDPLARVLGCMDRGTRPELMGQGVVPAVERLLQLHQLTVDQIDFWEINEAFSVVPLYAIQKLGIDPERVNVQGGALALGHPLGATGIRLAGTLARTLAARSGRYGIAAACIGGGQGIALLLENPG